MSLERELVFQLRKDGTSEADVLEIVAMMGNPDILKTKPVKLNHRLVNVALRQYNAIEELKKRKQYVKRDREKLKELIDEKTKEIRNTVEDLLSVRVKKEYRGWARCKNCGGKHLFEYSFGITYVNGRGRIPTPVKSEQDNFYHCDTCGYNGSPWD